MSECFKRLRDASDALVVQFQRRGAVRMAVDAGSPAEVAVNTPAKTFGEVGGVKGAVSPSQSAHSHRKR